MDSPSTHDPNDSGRSKSIASSNPLPAATPSLQRKILVVEDERVTQTVISLILRGVGYTVLVAKDAATALGIIRTGEPDLMTLDIDLSAGAAGEAWDGFKIVEWLKHYRGEKSVPFIIISGGNPATLKERAQNLGAFGYLPKPVSKQALLEMVRSAIGEAPAPPPSAAPLVPPKPSPPPLPPKP